MVERRAKIEQLYREGGTLEEIGQALGVTRERARQLIDAYGIDKQPLSERRFLTAVTGREQEIEALFLELRSDDAVAERAGIRPTFVTRVVGERIPDANVLRRRPRGRQDKYSDNELLGSLQEGARDLPSPMAGTAYADWAKDRTLDDGRPVPGPQAAMLRFGSWRAALTRAGLPSNPRSGAQPSYDLEDGINAVVSAWLDGGSPPTVASYETWRTSHPDHPSSATVRNLVNGWDELTLAAWPIVHGRPLPGVGATELEPGPAPNSDEPRLRFGQPYRVANEAVSIAEGDPFERDPQLLERALASHMSIQNKIAELLMRRGMTPLSPLASDPEFDLAWQDTKGQITLVEVKSTTATNLESQLRLGLGQVLRYGQILSGRGEHVTLLLVTELPPRDAEWQALADRVGVHLVGADQVETVLDGMTA